MSDDAYDDGYDEDGDLVPSVAIPPIYLLQAATRCTACGEFGRVYTIGCDAFRDRGDPEPIRDFHFLHFIEKIPEDVLALLTSRCPGYFFDEDEMSDSPYLMNHCRCGAKFDDTELHGDVGGAFAPSSPAGFARIQVTRLPFDEPFPVKSSYAIGGGEYLKIDKVGK